MSENTAFKNYYDEKMARRLADDFQRVYPAFDGDSYVAYVAPKLPPLELKARVAVFTEALREHLPGDYRQAVAIILDVLGPELTLAQGMFNDGWFVMPLVTFVEYYGLDDLEVSLQAMHVMTQRFSAEFAIRPFLQKYPEQTLARLHTWVTDPSPHVRRLVSEGTRPRLPWASRLPQFIADPTPTLALLEKLKDDETEYVRRSVANHLNDIAKDHPALVVATCRHWLQDATPEREWVVRHALRTLVKAGDPEALAVLGFGAAQVTLTDFVVETAVVPLGSTLDFRFTLTSTAAAAQELVIDYVIDFMKANGRTSPKVFKLTVRTLAAGESLTLNRRHPIRPVTTRTYYAGQQRVAVQVNGRVLGSVPFELVMPD